MSRRPPDLVFCAAGNPANAAMAVGAGWRYGARLPGHASQAVWFADQDWRDPNRAAYMAALAKHRPHAATVLDWEREEQLDEVLSWAEEAAQYVSTVYLIPKVVGGIPKLPREVGGKPVVLAYSVPTSYGGSPVPLWEHWGWPVHLLGGSPHRQMDLWRYLSPQCDVVSVDGNGIGWHARRGRCWQRARGRDGHWWQLRDLGDSRAKPASECLRRSFAEVRLTWLAMCGEGGAVQHCRHCQEDKVDTVGCTRCGRLRPEHDTVALAMPHCCRARCAVCQESRPAAPGEDAAVAREWLAKVVTPPSKPKRVSKPKAAVVVAAEPEPALPRDEAGQVSLW